MWYACCLEASDNTDRTEHTGHFFFFFATIMRVDGNRNNARRVYMKLQAHRLLCVQCRRATESTPELGGVDLKWGPLL